MQEYMRVCPLCEKEMDRSIFTGKLHVPGWFDWYINEECCINKTCNTHKEQKLIKVSMTCEEFNILREISNEPSFMQAMNTLKDNNIIEYNLKMSQFRQQVQMQQQQQQSSIPHCPTCGSTNLKKISGLSKAGSVALWGIFAAGRTSKTWHCNNCEAEW